MPTLALTAGTIHLSAVPAQPTAAPSCSSTATRWAARCGVRFLSGWLAVASPVPGADLAAGRAYRTDGPGSGVDHGVDRVGWSASYIERTVAGGRRAGRQRHRRRHLPDRGHQHPRSGGALSVDQLRRVRALPPADPQAVHRCGQVRDRRKRRRPSRCAPSSGASARSGRWPTRTSTSWSSSGSSPGSTDPQDSRRSSATSASMKQRVPP